MNKSVFIAFLFSLIAIVSNAQSQVEMADSFRADGKIYVVVGVVAIILTGIIVYLFLTEKKLKALEEKLG